MDDDLKHLLEAMREENAATRQENAAAHQETRRHFDVVLERIETRFDLLAETVQHVSEELQRTGGAGGVEAATSGRRLKSVRA